MNGPKVLTDEQANAIAEKWLSEKKRRRVTPRGMKDVLEYGKKIEENRMKLQTVEDDDDESSDLEDFQQ